MIRRDMLRNGAAMLALVLGGKAILKSSVGDAWAESFEITRTDADWQKILTPAQFGVLRREDTERAWTSPLLHEKRKGTFKCAGCDLALYSSDTKYESGTGWPSFWEALPGAVGTKTDSSHLMTRVEVHCHRCGGHLGHIFDDGPPPTGKRHCINGLALNFEAAST
ncbi:MAG: peptide-methionine (R)-S-oxide reductase MsrB [Phyllobacterium sp.]